MMVQGGKEIAAFVVKITRKQARNQNGLCEQTRNIQLI